jgi:hypothetical protein
LELLVLPVGILALLSLEQGSELAALLAVGQVGPPSPAGCLALLIEPGLMHPPAAGLS